MTNRYPTRLVAVSCLLLAISTICAPRTWAQPYAFVQDAPGAPAYVAGDVLVQFKPQATDAQLLDALTRAQLGVVRHIQTPAMKASGHPGISRMWTRLPVRQAIQALQNHPAVEFAEPNWVYTHQAVSDDPYFTANRLWGMYGDASAPANTYGSQAAEAWAAGYTGSKDVVVGVIDEGMQVIHPDLAANVWINPHEIANNGVDDDGNGYIDDIYGWDFYENNNSVYDGTGDDHGTHVTGTIGAVGGNGVGVVGVNWSVSMISGKFLGPNGGYTSDAIEAVDYFTALKTRSVNPINVVALNNSWGGGGYSQALHDAIIRAAKAGILFVAAAGNGNRAGKAINTDSSPVYPACYDTTVGTSTETAASYDAVISVTAINSSGNKASWANYGATTVDLGAPGVSIESTLPTDSYGAYSGTSMATPHVTGAIALYASTHPGESAANIKNAILAAAAATPALAGSTVTGGRLDLSTIVTPSAPLDDPPTVSITSPSSGSTASGPVTIIARAQDDSGVTKVEFFVGETSLGEGTYDGADLWSVSWDTTSTTYPDGNYTLTARATDHASQTTTSDPVTVTVDNIDDPPTVVITSPTAGSTVSGTVTITADASDDRGVSQVEFLLLDGTVIGTDEDGADGWSASWDTTTVADDSYTLAAVAADTAGQTRRTEITVTVDNSVPAAVHSGDLDGTPINHGSTWTASVTVTVHDGSHNTVSGAGVTGTWSGGFSGSATGTTGINGQVTFTTGSIGKKNGTVNFAITGITVADLTYNATANHDPDGDSDGTSIMINKP